MPRPVSGMQSQLFEWMTGISLSCLSSLRSSKAVLKVGLSGQVQMQLALLSRRRSTHLIGTGTLESARILVRIGISTVCAVSVLDDMLHERSTLASLDSKLVSEKALVVEAQADLAAAGPRTFNKLMLKWKALGTLLDGPRYR